MDILSTVLDLPPKSSRAGDLEYDQEKRIVLVMRTYYSGSITPAVRMVESVAGRICTARVRCLASTTVVTSSEASTGHSCSIRHAGKKRECRKDWELHVE